MGTKIPWCDETINPIKVKGGGYHCTKVSPGCDNCYAERTNCNKFMNIGNYQPFDGQKVEFELDEVVLEKPLHWKRPRKIFVQSMGDLFHPDIPDEYISKVWDAMWAAQQHIFLILTKRPERMLAFIRENAYAKHFGWEDNERVPFKPGDLIHIDDLWMRDMCGWTAPGKCDCNGGYICDYPADEHSGQCEHGNRFCLSRECPIACDNPPKEVLTENDLEGQYEIDKEGYSIDCEWMQLHTRPKDAYADNVWLGVTAENQEMADLRIPILLQIPAAVRFVSVEPMLGHINIAGYLGWNGLRRMGDGLLYRWAAPKIDWVICGGETGPKARPMHPDWVRSLREQCQAAGVPYFFKQWGEWVHESQAPDILENYNPEFFFDRVNSKGFARVGKKIAGDLLDGKQYHEFPEVTR